MTSVSTITLAALLVVLANSNAKAEPVLLSCWGTVELIQQGNHYTAVIDGVVWDTIDPCGGGMRCVYGYWRKL